MEFDVVVVGAGPAGLSAAIKLSQLAQQQEQEVSICVVEKGSEVGAHILSGAVLETSALDELLPDWQSMGSPLTTEVKEDVFYYYTSGKSAFQILIYFCLRQSTTMATISFPWVMFADGWLSKPKTWALKFIQDSLQQRCFSTMMAP
jgi:hypothetical protein